MVLGGLRHCEVLGLTLGVIQVPERSLFIAEGKGGHQRVIPISNTFLGAVGDYLRHERPRDAATDRVFVTLKGPNRGRPMTADAAALASIEAATRELRLPGIRLHAGRLAGEAQRATATHLGFLADTLSVEVGDRAERRCTRRIHEARFRRSRRLADFNFDVAPTVNPATIATLATGSYLEPATRSCCSATQAPAGPTC